MRRSPKQSGALRQKGCRSAFEVLLAVVLLSLLLPSTPSFGEHAANSALPFRGEIRYHFREKLSGTAGDENKVSAPATETEELPASRLENIDGRPVFRVTGRVKHLPFDFDIQLDQAAGPDSAVLKVKIIDPASQQPLAGFPQVIPNATAKLKEGIEFDLPLSPEQKSELEHGLLGEGTILTYANLVLTPDSAPGEGAVPPARLLPPVPGARADETSAVVCL